MVRIARTGDGAAIAEIYRPYVEGSAATLEEDAPSASAMAERIGRDGADLPFPVLEEDGEVLGFACASRRRDRPASRWCVEDFVYVREGELGRGLGRALLSSLVEILRELGYFKVYAYVVLPNPECVSLHIGLGFSPLCRYPAAAFKLGAWRDIHCMELALRIPPLREDESQPLEPIAMKPFARANSALISAILEPGG